MFPRFPVSTSSSLRTSLSWCVRVVFVVVVGVCGSDTASASCGDYLAHTRGTSWGIGDSLPDASLISEKRASTDPWSRCAKGDCRQAPDLPRSALPVERIPPRPYQLTGDVSSFPNPHTMVMGQSMPSLRAESERLAGRFRARPVTPPPIG